jgi:N terminus of Rad21 / Rec8 like protein/Conserved region of Rad21 / Rec8 like protein
MDLLQIVTGSLKVAWIAGTRSKSLTRVLVQKSQLVPVIEEIKSRSFSLKFLGILLYGVCILVSKNYVIVEEDLVKILKSTADTPNKHRISDISARSNLNTLRSALKYSGEKLSILSTTPPSLEITRKGYQARLEDITLIEYKGNQEIQRESFGVNEFFDTNVYQDSLSLGIHIENPAEINTPNISPNMHNIDQHTTTKKRTKRKNLKVLCKYDHKSTARTYQEFFKEKNLELTQFPEEMMEMIEFFRDKVADIAHNIVIETDQHDDFRDTINKNEINQDFEVYDIPKLDFNIQMDFEGSLSPVKIFTPIKSMQTTEFEIVVKDILLERRECFFSEIVDKKNRLEAAKAFSSLMTLAYTSGIRISQKKQLGDIIIKIL